MLTKEDKKWMKEEIKNFFLSEEFENMLGNMVMKASFQSQNRDMVFEDSKTEKGRTVEKTTEVNVLDQIVKYLPYIEGAIRGIQEDVDKMKNNVAGNNEKLRVVGETLIRMEQGARNISLFADKLKQIDIKNNGSGLLIHESNS